jgi:hypothetical protein
MYLQMWERVLGLSQPAWAYMHTSISKAAAVAAEPEVSLAQLILVAVAVVVQLE